MCALDFQTGIKIARNIINTEDNTIMPTRFSDEFLYLVLTCYEDENSQQIILPIMLVIHLWRLEGFVDDGRSLLTILYERYVQYHKLCRSEWISRENRVNRKNGTKSTNKNIKANFKVNFHDEFYFKLHQKFYQTNNQISDQNKVIH